MNSANWLLTELSNQLLARVPQGNWQGLLDWTTENRPFLKEGVPLDFRSHRYLPGIYEVLVPNQSGRRQSVRRVIVQKAAQVGISELAISYAIHAALERAVNVLYVFPTDLHVGEFSAARFGPAFDVSPKLQPYAERRRGSTQRVRLRQINNSFIYFRGATVDPGGNAKQLKSVDVGVVILDEVDEMDARAIVMSEKRLGHSLVKEMLLISTPSYTGRGINTYYIDSDQREWHLKCPRCNNWQNLTINDFVSEWDDFKRPVAWHGSGSEVHPICRKCGSIIDRLGTGEWVAAFPGRLDIGFKVTKLYSPQNNPADIVRGLVTLDESKRKEIYNQDLGESYRPAGGGLTDDVLRAVMRDYQHGFAANDRMVMGVDVAPSQLHVVIRGGVNHSGERPQRFAGVMTSFDDVEDLITSYRVSTCVIDAMPEHTQARILQNKFRDGLVWLAYYSTNRTEKYAEPVRWDEDQYNVHLDRTRVMDETFSRFAERQNTIPRLISETYLTQLKAPVKVQQEGADGSIKYVYIEDGPDHFAHAEVYATAASLKPRKSLGILSQKVTRRVQRATL